MKTRYLLAPLAAIALAGCTVYRPVAYTPTPVVTTPATVVTTPATVVTVPSTTVLGAGDPRLIDSDGDGYSNAIDLYPNNALYH